MPSIFSDGGTVFSNPSPYGITYAYRLLSDASVIISEGSQLLKGNGVTNNMAEYIAVLFGLANTITDQHITIYTDSLITIGRISLGWKTTGIPKSWKERMDVEMNRLNNNVSFELLDGHATKAQLLTGIGKRGNKCSEHNLWCDKQCQLLSKQFLTNINTSKTMDDSK